MQTVKRSKAGKSKKVQDIINDPKTPKLIKGWFKQEINREGISYSKARLPPGYNLAHYRGYEAAKGYDYRFTALQDIGLHKLQHKYDNKGLKNKTPKNIEIKTGKELKAFRSRSDLYDYAKKLENESKSIIPKTKIGPNEINSLQNTCGKVLKGINIVINIADITSKFMSGDNKGAIVEACKTLGKMGGEKIGALIGESIGGIFGSVPGVIIGNIVGSYIGGWIGDYLGSKAGEAIFEVCFNGAGLNENDGKTGGVEIRIITSLKVLKLNISFLFSPINLIAFQLNSEIPEIIEKLLPGVKIDYIVHRIIYELYYGVVVQHAPILFSLHFAKEGYLYPVIHPYYRNTLTGYILGLLDYFLKGFINGGTYKPEFLLEWDKTKNMDSDYLKQNVFDIREELKRANLQSLEYLSLRELYDEDDDQCNGKQKYFSAFRILGKTKKVQSCCQVLIPDCDFDVEHDLNPSIEVLSELSKSTPSEFHTKHKAMENAYQRMHDQIHTKMPKVPLFAPWFELLKIVSFGAHYVQTLTESGIQPCIPEPDLIKSFPTAMPPIPIRKVKTFQINLTLYDFVEQLQPPIVKMIDDHLYKIITDELLGFELIENILKDESRKLIKKKLIEYLPIQQVESRDDSELQINAIVLRIEGQIQSIISFLGPRLLRMISKYKDILKENQSFESLLKDLEDLSFQQQLDLARQKFVPIYQQEIDKQLQNCNNETQKIEIQNDFNKQLENIEKQFDEFENDKKTEFSSFFKKNDITDTMKKVILLDKIRLSFIDVSSDSAWSQNIRGGCSIRTFNAPEVVQELTLPFDLPHFQNKNFETKIQNYLISGIQVEHRWYASPRSFVKNSLDIKNFSTSENIDNLGGKRIIDCIIETGNLDLLRSLAPENIDSPNNDGFSPLLTAVSLANYELVKVLLEEFHADFNYKHPNGLTPLIVATQSGNTEISMLLLEQPGIQIDVSLDTGMSPMHFAISNSDIDVVKKLTNLGLYADSENSIRNKDGCNAFLYAAKLGFFKGLELMTVRNKDCCSADGSNALHFAAGSDTNSLKCVELLYKKFNVSPDKQNCRRQYPLHIAIEARNDDSAIFLYDICSHCASSIDDRNKTPKDLAITYRAVGFLQYAFPSQSLINEEIQKETRNIEDSIQDAIFRINIPDTSRLISELANKKNNLKILEKLIMSTLVVGSEQLLDIVIRATPDIRIVKFSHKMVLSHLVVKSGQYKIITAVSKLGFTFDEKDDLNNTAISYAVLADDSKTMKQILKCRENTENLMSLFQESAQKSFENRKINCAKALIKFQLKSKKNQINNFLINGTYLCNNLNVTPADVNMAIQMGLEIKKSDVLTAAAKSTPEVLTLIIQHFCKENDSLKTEIIIECLEIACKNARLDNILELRKIHSNKNIIRLNSLIKEIKAKTRKYSFWILEALNGDSKGLIQKKIQEIGNLIKKVKYFSNTNGNGIRKKLSNLLREFPLKNIKMENGMPFLHYSIRFDAIWALSCLPKDYDISQKIDGFSAYDLLPLSAYNLFDSLWDSPNINKVFESLTFNFSQFIVCKGVPSDFISIVCKTVENKMKYLKCKNLLHILISSKASVKDLEQIIVSRSDWCKCADENGCTPLMHAVFIQNYELARLIIKNIQIEDIKFRNYSGNNVLHCLILSSDFENRDLIDFALELVSKCPQLLRMSNREGHTPCSLAATKGQITLLAAFGSYDYFDPENIIHSAASANQVNVIKFLLNSDCSSIRIDPNARLHHITNKNQDYGDNFLHSAAKSNSVDAFIELVKLGTNPIEVNSKNKMPIEIAFQNGNFKLIKFIMTIPSLLNASSSIKSIAITSCAMGSSRDIRGLDAMIKTGYPITSIHHSTGYPLIHCAAISDNADTIHLVLNSGADILAVSTLMMTVLHLCSILNKPNALRTCLEWASFCLSKDEYWKLIEAKDEENCTALHYAAKFDNEACTSILLAYGANPNSLNSKQLTPSQLAVVSNSLKSLGVIVQIANDKTYNGSYPLEYEEIVNLFKERIVSKDITIPQKLDKETIQQLKSFTKNINQRLMPLNLNNIDDSLIECCENDEIFYDFHSKRITKDEFLREFGQKYGENAVKLLQKFSSYPLSQIQLVRIIKDDSINIDELDFIIKNIDIDIIASILPSLPADTLIPFMNTLKQTIKIADQCPAIWEWFKAYFTLPCISNNKSDEKLISNKDDFTGPFDYLLITLGETKCFNDLPWPKLPRLSVFTGEKCSMLTVKKALSECTDKALQIKNINEIPLNIQKIEKFISYSQRPKYFGNAFLWCRDGSIIIYITKNVQNDGFINSFHLVSNIDAFTLLTIRAMFAGINISDFLNDFNKEKEETRYIIIKTALQLNSVNYMKVREWCAAGLLCSEQCGYGILKQLCDLISTNKCSISDILYICNIISRLNDTSKIESALNSSDPKEKIVELLSKEENSKNYETLIKEMSTSYKGEFQPYKFAFDGTPVFCLQENDISSLDLVYEELISYKSPSSKREIQEEFARLGNEMNLHPNCQSLGQMLAILSHSFEIIFKIKPYLIQCMTVAGLVLSEINPIKGLKGRIAQVATGEGKSIDIVLLASICAAQGRFVDVITSTHYLAKRDYLKYAPFYEFIGLTCGCIAKEPKPLIEDFNGLILYGINTDFEFTILREGVNGIDIQKTQKFKGGPLETRIPNTIITDESDNLFIDNAINSARISWKSNENVSWVFAPLYQQLSKTKNYDVKKVRKFLSRYLNKKFTKQVSEWSDETLQKWISSFLMAQNQVCGRDYVIGINESTGQKEVQIVHLGTGRILHGCRWNNGIHEFIEAREGLIPKNEEYTIASISHPAFFKKYKHIYGLTGTAGELVERTEIMKTYKVDTFDVPPNRKCLRMRLPTEILKNDNELQNRLIEIIIETQKLSRPLLLLFLSIDDTIKFSQKLSRMKISHMVLNELQREDEDYIVFRAGQPGVVTIATNTAGRGTDIVLSPISKINGGLRVAFTFFPNNFRVECQGLGRAGRQGQPGTAEIITSLDDPYIIELIGKVKPSTLCDESFIKNLYQQRSNQIEAYSQIRMMHSLNEVKLFNALSVFFKKFRQIKDRFLNDQSLQNEFEKDGINSLNIWTFVEMIIQQEWAKTFSFFCKQSNMEQKIIDKYLGIYDKKFLKPLLQVNVKNVVTGALKIYQKLDTMQFDEKDAISAVKKIDEKIQESDNDESYIKPHNDPVYSFFLLFLVIIMILFLCSCY